MKTTSKKIIPAFAALTLLIVGLSVTGGIRFSSPVPFWDMWTGILRFFVRVNEGDLSAWWDLHNEHRIILSRLLFWADMKWFEGLGHFLVVINYLLVSASAILFWRILRIERIRQKPTVGEIVAGLLITAWLFLWIQEANLTIGFQCQFFLAQLLPLCAFYWQYRSIVSDHTSRDFITACGFGIAAVGTMANGVITLPLMTCYALLTRQSLKRTTLLLFLSAITLWAYFYDYASIPGHPSLSATFKENPLGVLQYVVLYIGSPFYYLAGGDELGQWLAQLAGIMLIGSALWFALKTLPYPQHDPLRLALLFFILYVGGTALGTAGGRLFFGLEQALSSRYTTPALMAWAALFVLYAPLFLDTKRPWSNKKIVSLLVLALLMVPPQLKALHPSDIGLFEKQVSALAFEMGVNDQRQSSNIFFNSELGLSIAEKPVAQNLSIFGQYPYRDVRKQLGATFPLPPLPACMTAADWVEEIDSDPRFVRIYGWLFDPNTQKSPQAIRFFDQEGRMTGYALGGFPRSDVAKALGQKHAISSGYRGYLLSSQVPGELFLQGETITGALCRISFQIPASSPRAE